MELHSCVKLCAICMFFELYYCMIIYICGHYIELAYLVLSRETSALIW